MPFHLWQGYAIAIKTKRRNSKLVITENKTRQILQNTNIFLRPDTHRLTSIPLKMIRNPLVFWWFQGGIEVSVYVLGG